MSIPDQRKQGEAYCAARGYQRRDVRGRRRIRRREFQQMKEAGTTKPAPFEVMVAHSFSRFFRDHVELELYIRKLAKNGIRLVSITAPMLRTFARTARPRIRLDGMGYRRDHRRARAQRVEVADDTVRIVALKSDLLRTLAAAGGAGKLPGAVPTIVPKWRATPDKDEHYVYAIALLYCRREMDPFGLCRPFAFHVLRREVVRAWGRRIIGPFDRLRTGGLRPKGGRARGRVPSSAVNILNRSYDIQKLTGSRASVAASQPTGCDTISVIAFSLSLLLDLRSHLLGNQSGVEGEHLPPRVAGDAHVKGPTRFQGEHDAVPLLGRQGTVSHT